MATQPISRFWFQTLAANLLMKSLARACPLLSLLGKAIHFFVWPKQLLNLAILKLHSTFCVPGDWASVCDPWPSVLQTSFCFHLIGCKLPLQGFPCVVYVCFLICLVSFSCLFLTSRKQAKQSKARQSKAKQASNQPPGRYRTTCGSADQQQITPGQWLKILGNLAWNWKVKYSINQEFSRYP